VNRHALRVLEFEKIRTQLRQHCLTAEADEALHKERVRQDPAEIDELISLSTALRRCLQSTVKFPMLSFPPLEDLLVTLEKDGSVLEPPELAAIASYARSAALLRDYLVQTVAETGDGTIGPLVDQVPDLKPVAEHVAKFVDADGTVREREIPELKRIRAQINRAQQELSREAQGLLGRDDLRRYWNASVPTQREGRTVLALKADHRGKVTGIVHEVSSTGATIFIEPDSLVQRNNGVTEANNRYHMELLRILRELSRYCRDHHGELVQCVLSVTEIDKVYARARYAIANNCTAVRRSDGTVTLRAARHPLLGESAVPISLEFPAGKRLMVVTGPNTGGKTVGLKTVGLLALMNQFGMEVPVAPDSELPVFNGIFADIGDEQSIEQSLSTFSGHMRNIGRILNSADENSLVLLDELGSGTDPEEGGALAMAILDELLARGPHTIVTTHHGALKHYGFTQPAATNASVEFDQKSLRPTFRIIPGVPGSSHAIEVAAHMGILRKVTGAAKTYLKGEEYDTGRIIRTLTDREQELHRERETLQAGMQTLQSERDEIQSQRDELAGKENELRRGKLRELESWSAGARSQLENLVRELREGELTREKMLRVKEFIAETGDQLAAERAATSPDTAPVRLSREPGETPMDIPLSAGIAVRLRSSGKKGIVQRRAKGSQWQVQLGALRLSVDESDLVPIRESTILTPSVAVAGAGKGPSFELDLRGKRLEEALDEVERQIDQALLTGMQRFGIIHGTGEGVLQKGVRDLLRRHPHVGGYSYARPEEGGYGKINVDLG
jgi:DNA mismatch repair protein MutS2